MENNLQNKAIFFARYFGQKVLHIKNSPIPFGLNSLKFSDVSEKDYLGLKPLSEITDQQMLEIGVMLRGKPFEEVPTKEQISEVKSSMEGFVFANLNGLVFSDNLKISNLINLFDYLRSKGYALPFMGLSVEQLVDYGWVKLKTK